MNSQQRYNTASPHVLLCYDFFGLAAQKPTLKKQTIITMTLERQRSPLHENSQNNFGEANISLSKTCVSAATNARYQMLASVLGQLLVLACFLQLESFSSRLFTC